jgi:ATPase subunit of ABC transporter with duplicated ATPase domains
VRIQQQQPQQQQQLEQQQPVVRTLKKSQKLAPLEQQESRRILQLQKVEQRPQKVQQNNNYRT